MAKRCVQCDSPALFGDKCGPCVAAELEMDDDDFGPEGPAFECAGFNDGSGFYCPLWGSEECDWECPSGGKA